MPTLSRMRYLAARLLLCLLVASPFAEAAQIMVAASQDTPALQQFVADLAARLLLAPAELPIGTLTALLVAPFFLYLLLRERF